MGDGSSARFGKYLWPIGIGMADQPPVSAPPTTSNPETCVGDLRKSWKRVGAEWVEVAPMAIKKGDEVKLEGEGDRIFKVTKDAYREPLGPPEQPFRSWVPAFQFEDL